MPSTSVPPPAIEALPRQAVRDPDYWLLVAAFVLLFLCGIQLLIFPFGRSEAAHAMVGRAIVQGYMPVRDIWTADSPGIGLLHAAIQLTLGRSMMAFRATELIALVGVVLGATRITKRWVGLERAGLIGGALFALTYVQLEIDQTGQPEFFAGVLLLHAVAVVSREPSPQSARMSALLVGLLLGLVLLLVPPLVVTVVPFALLLFHRDQVQASHYRRPWRVGANLVFGLLSPVVCLWIWFIARNAGHALVADWLKPTAYVWITKSFVEWAWQYCELAYGLTLQQSALLSAGLLSAFTLGTIHEHEAAGRRLLLRILCYAMIGLVAQHKGTPSALTAVLPLASVVAGIGIYKAWRRMLTQGALGMGTFAAIAIILFQMCSPLSYPPGSFLRRSKARLLYLTSLTPFRSREMLESELYNSKEFSLTASRRLAATLRERSLSNRDVWILSDDPQLAWLLDDIPKWRFIQPVPALMSRFAPQLNRERTVGAFLSQAPNFAVVDQSSDNANPVDISTRLRSEYAPIETRDAWTIIQRVPKRVPVDDSEFCDPNVN